MADIVSRQLDISSVLGGDKKSDALFALKLFNIKRKLLNALSKSIPQKVAINPELTVPNVMGQPRAIEKITALPYTAIQLRVLHAVSNAIPKSFTFDNSAIKIGDILGQEKGIGILTGLKWTAVQRKILNAVKESIPDTFTFDDKVSIGDLLGQPRELSKSVSSAWSSVQRKILKNIKNVIPQKFTFDKKVKINDLLGQTPQLSKIMEFGWKSLQSKILRNIKKTLPEKFSFKKQITLGDIFGETPRLALLSRLQLFRLRSYILTEVKKAVNRTISSTVPSRSGNNQSTASNVGDRIAKIGEGLGKGIKGLGSGVGKGIELILTGLAKGLKQLSNPRLLIGTAVIAAVGGALWVSAKAFKEFGSNIDWKNVFIGIGALALVAVGLKLLGKAAGQILIGSLALLAISGAFYVAAKAFQQFADISWKDVFIGIGALTLVGVVAAAAGAFAPLILLGSLALAALGVALIPVAYAFKLFGEAAIPFAKAFGIVGEAIGKIIGVIGDTFVKILDSITNTIERLSAIGSEGLIGTAAGIGALGIALATFGAGSFIGSLLNFFSKDPVEDFERFGKIAPNLEIAGNAIEKLTKSLNTFDFGLLKKLGSNLLDLGQTIAKDNILSSFTQLSGIADIFKTVSDSATTFTNALKSMIDLVSTDDGGIDLLIEKLYELGDALNSVSNLSNIGTTIVPQLQSAALTPTSAMDITPLKTNTSGEALHYETMLTQSAKEDAANSAASVMIGSSTNSVKTQNTVNNSNVTYNTTDAFDNTQLRVLRNYMF